MKPYQDKITGLWKWGTRGEAIYSSKHEAQKQGLRILTDKLRKIRDKLNVAIQNDGK